MNIERRLRQSKNRIAYAANAWRHKIRTGTGRPRIVFAHTPKTGGISITSYFKEHVGSRRSGRTILYEDFVPDRVERFVERAHEARFVTGHMPWQVFDRVRDKESFSFTILRNPFDRLRSLYFYSMNLPELSRFQWKRTEMGELTLEEFLLSPNIVARRSSDNYLARQFAGLPLDDFPETEEDCRRLADAAIQNLSSLDLVGVSDFFDEAFFEVAKVAGLPQPPRGRRMNATSDLRMSDEQKKAANSSFDDEQRKLALPRVRADLMVYEHFRDRAARS